MINRNQNKAFQYQKILFLGILLLLGACKTPIEEQKIKTPIAREHFKAILLDMHIANGIVENQKIRDVKITNQLKKAYLSSVLAQHEVSLADFETTFARYEDKPAIMHKMYEEILEEVSVRQAKLEGKEESEN